MSRKQIGVVSHRHSCEHRLAGNKRSTKQSVFRIHEPVKFERYLQFENQEARKSGNLQT